MNAGTLGELFLSKPGVFSEDADAALLVSVHTNDYIACTLNVNSFSAKRERAVNPQLISVSAKANEKDPIAVRFGAIIREARLERRWTQRDLSREARYDAISLSRLESGDVMPKLDAAFRLTAALGIGFDAVVTALTTSGTEINRPQLQGRVIREAPVFSAMTGLDHQKLLEERVAEIDRGLQVALATAQMALEGVQRIEQAPRRTRKSAS